MSGEVKPGTASEWTTFLRTIATQQDALGFPCKWHGDKSSFDALADLLESLEKEGDERLRRIYLFEECIENDGKRIAALEKERDEAAARLETLLQRIDEMPNPHSDPMRHYYNQMQGWKDEARGIDA
jgi:hypothetical protein